MAITGAVWIVLSLGAPHIGERSEAEMIQAFVDRIAEFRSQMVTFNGSSFDLPVLRYRAMISRVSAPGLECRRYWYRYSDDCLDRAMLWPATAQDGHQASFASA